MVKRRDVIRPIYGLVAFQPFAALWCWMTDTPYWETLGGFMVYATVCYIPIYALYERWF